MDGSGAGGVGDPGSGGSANPGDCSSLLVCDDFESATAGGAPDAALWVVQATVMGSSVTVTDEDAYSGSQSVKVVAPSGQAFLTNTSAFPTTTGAVYFRARVKYLADTWEGHITFIESGTNVDPNGGGEVRFGGQAGYYHANLSDDGDGLSPDPFEYPSCGTCVAPVANEWHCLAGGFDPAANTATLAVNGVTAVDASSADDWHSGSGVLPQDLVRLSFGWEIYGGIANTIYFDDIAISDQPLSCP